MPTNTLLGTADAVAQVTSIQITANDVATTYTLTVGGQTASTLGNAGGALATAQDLAAAWAAQGALNKIYFSSVNASDDAVDAVLLTAGTEGVPFEVSSSVNGGAGTIGAPVITIANSGPNDWNVPANWSLGIVPINGHDVVLADSDVDIAWGLDQSGVLLASLTARLSYTGRIGLDRVVFATSADARTFDESEVEYRDTYLQIGSTIVNIGENFSPSVPAGSSRIMLDLGADISTVTIFGIAQTPSETGRPAFRMLCNNAGTNLFVRRSIGGVGVAKDAPGEVSLMDTVSISDISTTSRVFTGPGVTFSAWVQSGGQNVVQSAAALPSVKVNGGVLSSEGDFALTLLDLNEGTMNANNINSGGDAIGTANLNGGTMVGTGSNKARVWNEVNPESGAVLSIDDTVVTITTLNTPSGLFTMSID